MKQKAGWKLLLIPLVPAFMFSALLIGRCHEHLFDDFLGFAYLTCLFTYIAGWVIGSMKVQEEWDEEKRFLREFKARQGDESKK
jgi:hypothetical protein